MKTKRERPRIVTLDDGRKLPLAMPKALGDMPCPGQAHSNPWIDNCLLCAPRWGVTTRYERIADVASLCAAGLAVRVMDLDEAADDAARQDRRLEMIGATERRPGTVSHFYVYALRA
jgi:hypothetical protein